MKYSYEKLVAKFIAWANENGYDTSHSPWGVSIIFLDYNTNRAFGAYVGGIHCALDFALEETKPRRKLQVRMHRELLSESIETIREVYTTEEFFEYFKPNLPVSWQGLVGGIKVIHHYTHPTHRFGWEESYLVSLPGYGVLGFCDGPLECIRRG